MSPSTIAIIVLSCLVAAFTVSLFFRVDDRIEQRRKAAAAVAAELTKLGLGELAPLFTDYSTGDYAGLVREAERILKILQNPTKTAAMLSELFYDQLTSRMADPIERLKIVAEVDKPAANLVAAATKGTAVATAAPAAAAAPKAAA